MDPIISYSLDDFFTNVTGTYSIDIIANIKLSVLGSNKKVNGKQFEIYGSKLVINEIYSPKTFFWSGNSLFSSYGNKQWYFPKTGSTDCGFSILDFIIPVNQWNKFYYD